MKKQYFFALGLMVAGLTVSAQTNLVLNGDFENWTEANPENFTEFTTTGTNPQTYNDNITKETTIVMSGNSLRQTAQATTQYIEYRNAIEVIPGHSYTISYDYRDNDDHARTRIWSAWLQQNGTTYTMLTNDEGTLRYADQNLSYSTDNANWVHKTLTLTAPATATHFRFQVRTYRESPTADGGFIYYDNFSMIDNNAAGIGEHALTSVKMFPNPLNSGILTILTDSDTAKTVAIFDILGKEVVNAATDNNTISVSNLSAGVYIVKISQEGKTATRKLVVQ